MTHTRLVPLAVLLVALSGCADKSTPTTPTPDTPIVTALLLPSTLTLAVGDSNQIRAVAAMPDGTSKIVTTSGTWQSSNTAVATVSGAGIVTAIASGTANIIVTFEDKTSGTALTVTDTSTAPTTFTGTTAGQNSVAGTLTVSLSGGTRVDGALYVGKNLVSLFGRLDAPTNIVNLTGGGYVLLGTIKDTVFSGTITDSSGVTGGFASINATRAAVTNYCGTYTSDGTTALDNPDEGAFSLSVSASGRVSGASLVADASNAPVFFTGTRSGDSLSLTTNAGQLVSAQLQPGSVSGSLLTTIGSQASFTATTAACP